MAGRALGALLAVAVAALLVAAARAADDDKHWKCFRSCGKDCHHHNHNHANGSSATVATNFFPSGSGDASVSAVTAECKNGCQEDACFKDLPGISHTQCTMITCLSHPHHSKKKTECLKDCCEKCFKKKSPPSPSPPKPGPKPSPPKPGPPTPEPGPSPPEPGPSPPEPGPPEPEPGPSPPEPGPPEPEPGPPPHGPGPKPPSPTN